MIQTSGAAPMPRNIEIKARIESIAPYLSRTAAIASEGPIEIFQDDTFFACENGRLKLRAFSDQSGELIFYRRPDGSGPRESFYVRSPIHDPNALRETLSVAYGVVGRVCKQRVLFLVGRTRVHLDWVHDLGAFLELEVVMRDQEPPDIGMREAHELMERLGVDSTQLVERAYVDLLNDRVRPGEA
jgi:predicted adenylyl cyclase CyaB